MSIRDELEALIKEATYANFGQEVHADGSESTEDVALAVRANFLGTILANSPAQVVTAEQAWDECVEAASAWESFPFAEHLDNPYRTPVTTLPESVES